MAEVSIGEIRAAAGRIAGALERTPCLKSRTLSRLTGKWKDLDSAIDDSLAALSSPRLHRSP